MNLFKTPTIVKFLLRKLLQYIPTFFIILTIIFLLIHAAPGDPASILGGEQADLKYIERLNEKFGLDKPLLVQYSVFINNILHGDLGYAFTYNKPVMQVILQRIPATLLLMGTYFIITTILGIFLGTLISVRTDSWLSKFFSLFTISAYSIPAFWLGMLMIVIFSLQLKLFPALGMRSIGKDLIGINVYLDIGWHLFLPAVTMGVHQLALITRLTRASMLEELDQDYVRTAISKGLKETDVIFQHALKNALLPIINLVGMNAGSLVGGAVLTETVFNWPGIGTLVYDAINTRDYPLLMGVFILISIGVFIGNLIADIVSFYADPRIRSMG